MKLKAIIGCILVVAILSIASPVLALSLGVSPTQIELEVPSDGSVTANVQIHYFSGEVQISLIDIPLRIDPGTVHVEASEEPVEVELTIYGDSSLGSKVYEGYIRFIAVSGGAATGGVQVIAKITNLVEGETPILVTPEELQPPIEEKALVEEEEEVVELEEVESSLPKDTLLTTVEEGAPGPPLAPPTVPVETEESGLRLVGIIAGVIVTIILVAVFVRRKSWS